MRVLERTVADAVNAAYGLTPAEVDLMWRTAPPRMPLSSSVEVISPGIEDDNGDDEA
jgi:hypothetical protein